MKPLTLITGASSGIGRATAWRLAARGQGLALIARRQERLEALAGELRREHPGLDVLARPCDVSDARAVQALVAELESLAPIEGVVNAAGHGRGWGRVGSADAERWRELVDVNLLGSMFVVAACLPGLRARDRGHIINVGSIFALGTAPEWSAYAATKHGLRAFTQALRQELVDSRVRVSIIQPGSVNTEFGSVAGGSEPRTHPIESWPYRPLLPEQVAEAIAWMLSQPPEVEVTELVIRPTAERKFG